MLHVMNTGRTPVTYLAERWMTKLIHKLLLIHLRSEVVKQVKELLWVVLPVVMPCYSCTILLLVPYKYRT